MVPSQRNAALRTAEGSRIREQVSKGCSTQQVQHTNEILKTYTRFAGSREDVRLIPEASKREKKIPFRVFHLPQSLRVTGT